MRRDYRLEGELYHWPISAHGVRETVESLRIHLEKWLTSAEFLGARIEKLNMVNRDEINYHERLRWADYLARDAKTYETSDGHYFGVDVGPNLIWKTTLVSIKFKMERVI